MLASRSRAEYAGGYLFFGREDGLFAQAFDPATLTFSGEPRRITDGGDGIREHGELRVLGVAGWHTATWGGWMPVTQLTIVDRAGRLSVRSAAIRSNASAWRCLPMSDGLRPSAKPRQILSMSGWR